MTLIKRITNKHQGMKQESIIRLIQSFVISQITYIAAFHNWFAAEKVKINNLIKKAYKLALGIAISTSTDLFLKLGLHNTLEELIEAQQISQAERLTKTTTGRNILRKLGMNYRNQYGEKRTITREIREKLLVPNIPKNMHPGYKKGRHTSRAEKIIQSYGSDDRAAFIDAAEYPNRNSYVAIVIDHNQKLLTNVSVNTKLSETAEEVAIALALVSTNAQYIIKERK